MIELLCKCIHAHHVPSGGSRNFERGFQPEARNYVIAHVVTY